MSSSGSSAAEGGESLSWESPHRHGEVKHTVFTLQTAMFSLPHPPTLQITASPPGREDQPSELGEWAENLGFMGILGKWAKR